MKEKANCLRCKHYFVTWDARHPRGCQLYQFKGISMPSQMVWQSTGHECREFEQKERPVQKKLDLSSDDLW